MIELKFHLTKGQYITEVGHGITNKEISGGWAESS